MSNDRDINPENDPVLASTRRANAEDAANRMRAALGGNTVTSNGRQIASTKMDKSILSASEEKKNKEARDQREAFKRAQEALERALKALEEQLEAIKRQIAEAKKDILDVEEQLRKKYGDNWEEKFRRGEADKNDRLYQSWSRKHETLEELEKKYERIEELKKELGKEGLTPKMRAKLDELAEASDGKRATANAIGLLADSDKKIEVLESLPFMESSKGLASLSLQTENIYESAEELSFDGAKQSTSFAKTIDGSLSGSVSLKEDFRLKASYRNALPEKDTDLSSKEATPSVHDSSPIIPKNG